MTLGAQLTVTTQALDGVATVAAVGEIDATTSYRLFTHVDRVAADGHDQVFIDLGGVDFMDSTGVTVLVKLKRQHGSRVHVTNTSRVVKRLLDITGLTGLTD